MPRSLNTRERHLLILLACASMTAAFVNTLFTQTVAYAAEEFDISNTGQGVGAAIVRWGVFIAFPFVALADRDGRRKAILILAWGAPVVSALGAFAPNFATLVATQTVARPLGITLEILIMVVTIEEMPRTARALATGALAVAGGAGAGVAVASLPVADASPTAWRYVYVVALVWLAVAAALTRWLPETHRFAERRGHHVRDEHTDMSRLIVISVVAFVSNIFIASASIFQNRYLKDERGYSALLVAVFTTVTSIPASVGLLLGGRIADRRGRRFLGSTMVPVGALLLALSFTTSGSAMWLLAIGGGLAFGVAYPALAVYRGEMFPTRRRGVAGGTIMASALVGGSVGLIVAGRLIDGPLGYGSTMVLLSVGPILASLLVWFRYPETADRELEEINPGDQIDDSHS